MSKGRVGHQNNDQLHHHDSEEQHNPCDEEAKNRRAAKEIECSGCKRYHHCNARLHNHLTRALQAMMWKVNVWADEVGIGDESTIDKMDWQNEVVTLIRTEDATGNSNGDALGFNIPTGFAARTVGPEIIENVLRCVVDCVAQPEGRGLCEKVVEGHMARYRQPKQVPFAQEYPAPVNTMSEIVSTRPTTGDAAPVAHSRHVSRTQDAAYEQPHHAALPIECTPPASMIPETGGMGMVIDYDAATSHHDAVQHQNQVPEHREPANHAVLSAENATATPMMEDDQGPAAMARECSAMPHPRPIRDQHHVFAHTQYGPRRVPHPLSQAWTQPQGEA